jgi:hypothetical protein
VANEKAKEKIKDITIWEIRSWEIVANTNPKVRCILIY